MKCNKYVKDHMKKCDKKLRLFNDSDSLRPVLLLTSYCSNNSKCTEARPCEDCLKMCNIAFVNKEDIKNENVICGYDFLKDFH